jgi:predicted secreted protein
MNGFNGILVTVLVWWLTLFAVLPLRVRPANPADPDHAADGPAAPASGAQGGGDLARFSRPLK